MTNETMPSKERFKLISAVHLFLINEGKVLLLRRSNTGYEDGNFSVPAGHLEGDEPATSAMVREALEEAGISIKTSDLKVAHVMHRLSGDERMDLFFTTGKWSGNIKICEPEKCDLLEWFDLEDLPENIIPYIRSALKNVLQGVTYSEFGW